MSRTTRRREATNPAPLLRTASIPTPLGLFTAIYSSRGLLVLAFPDSHAQRSAGDTERLPAPWSQWHRLTSAALGTALRGRAPRGLPPLDLSSGTTFQQAVWRALRRIRPGRSSTYAQVAAAIGRPRAARAVGQACGANPIPVLIPCHRVLASNGGLGGFSAGLDWKRKLLGIERAL